jgi:ATP10 protein
MAAASSVGRYLSFGLLALSWLAAANDRSMAARIPEVHGTSLSNEAVNLPEALQGKVGVLVLGFSRGSRDPVAGWGKRLVTDYRESTTVAYYQMPVLASAPGMVRGLIVRSMKSSVPQVAQARFVPIMDNEAAWRTLVHYVPPDDPYLLVVDGQGNVVWQTQGQVTDTAYAALKQQVEALKGRVLR